MIKNYGRKGNLTVMGFQIDDRTKQEALNFATLMNLLNITEQKLEPLFDEFSGNHDIGIPMVLPEVIKAYSMYFEIYDTAKVERYYKAASRAFSQLRHDDEIIKRDGLDYPPLLLKTKQAPRFLYVRGRKGLLMEKRTVALIGSRQASDKAKFDTQRVAEALGKNGIVIVSGLAKGIDVTAHKTALDLGYNTIAVIGTSLNQYYPYENKAIQQEIEQRGLVVSQFSPATKTERWFFPLRNGVMSGLSLATVIMEAGERSGALRQANYALHQNRQVLIPSKTLDLDTVTWPKKYLAKGAETVATPREILLKLMENDLLRQERN